MAMGGGNGCKGCTQPPHHSGEGAGVRLGTPSPALSRLVKSGCTTCTNRLRWLNRLPTLLASGGQNLHAHQLGPGGT